MEQLEFFEIPSPCIGVCTANARGYCQGCYRSRDERFFWQQLTDVQKRQVMRLCQQRRRKVWLLQQQAQSAGEFDLVEPELFENQESNPIK